jgi:DNA-binding PadR family transcriptional regulator
MIAEQPRHGYELMRAIEERMGGSYSHPGVIYPTLSWLEDMGYTRVEAEGGRKSYAITDEGKVFLTANRAAIAPVAQFWSTTLDDVSTRGLIENGTEITDRSSRHDPVKNADGSVDLYFSPKAPAGFEKNWGFQPWPARRGSPTSASPAPPSALQPDLKAAEHREGRLGSRW